MIWLTSDLHFGHCNQVSGKGVIAYCNRPFKDIHEMNEELIKRWNECVRPEDTIYVLGDMALCPYKEFEPIAKRLNGKNKFLVQGNHDRYSVGQYNKLGFQVFQEIKMKIAGNMCRLSHYPYALPWYKRLFAYKSELRFLERRPPRVKGEWLLHGHSHVKYKKADNEKRIHVGVDAHNFYPVSIREIESLMGKK